MKYLGYKSVILMEFTKRDRWQMFSGWFHNLVKMLVRRFRWLFVLVGFVALSMAAISWSLESTGSYWFWHRLVNDVNTKISLLHFVGTIYNKVVMGPTNWNCKHFMGSNP